MPLPAFPTSRRAMSSSDSLRASVEEKALEVLGGGLVGVKLKSSSGLMGDFENRVRAPSTHLHQITSLRA